MNPVSSLYNEFLFRPLFNLLVGLTNVLPAHNVGISIVLVTLVVRIILLPFSIHQAKSATKQQTKIAKVQTELKRIKEQHKHDKVKQSAATMALYKEVGINPAAGCLPLLIQLPVLIALYRVFLIGLGPETYEHLYTFVHPPVGLQMSFFGIVLTEPHMFLALIAGLSQFALMRMTTQKNPAPATQDDSAQAMAAMQRNMAYIFPVMTILIALRLPAALALYWVATTIFAILQQYVLKYTLKLNITGHVPV